MVCTLYTATANFAKSFCTPCGLSARPVAGMYVCMHVLNSSICATKSVPVTKTVSFTCPKDVWHDEDDAKIPASDAWLRETQAMSSMKTEQRKHSYCTTELRKKHSIQACVSKQPAHNATLTSLVWGRCNQSRCPLMSLLRAECSSFQM